VKISVIIITYNEEKNIARCIDSVQDVADELIVVDSFSKDKTEEICLEKNVRFYKNSFEGYSEQKNYANSLAKYEFILSLDADEALSPELKKSILQEKEKGFTATVFEFNRLVFYCGQKIKHSGWYPDKKIRLWKNELAKWNDSPIHEKLEFKERITPKFLKGDLYHYTFHTISQHVEQINKFSTLKAQMAYDKNKKTNLLKIIFKPPIKFFIQYILRLGFLDGFLGFVVCKNSANAEFLKQVKLKQLYSDAKN